MKQVMLIVCMITLLFGSVVIAEESKSTIVGPVMENRYIAPNPQDKETKTPETVQTLKEKGVIQVREEARLEQKQQVLRPINKKQF